MASYTTMSSIERDSCKIMIGGKTYTMAEYKKMVKKQSATSNKPKKAKKKVKEIGLVAMEVEKLLKPITTLKSLSAYYDHAYRQWGVIAKEILNHRKINSPFISYRISFSELLALVSEIKKLAQKNEKAAYQFVEKITWKLDDIKGHIIDIDKGARDSGFIEAYKDKECINGKGRRLGLNTLILKSYDAINKIEDVIESLKKIVEDGTDPFEVGNHMSRRTKARCWA